MVRGDIPILYKFIHLKLIDKSVGRGYLLKREVVEVFRRTIRLPPKKFNREILQELEDFELIIKVNHKKGYHVHPIKLIVLDPFF